ncbi:hybrid signal transduction histidine kinase M [Tanacetum coccineum]
MTNPDQPSAPPTLTLVEKLYAVHNINTLVPEKLDLAESNYSTWSYFFKGHCSNFGVLKHIEGSSTQSSTSTPPTDDWITADSIVKSWIFLTLSSTLRKRLIKANPKTAKDAWDTIEAIFQDNKRTRVVALKGELRMIQMGDQTADEYFSNIDSIVTLLNDLAHKEPFPDLSTVRSMVSTEEMRIRNKSHSLSFKKRVPLAFNTMTLTGSVNAKLGIMDTVIYVSSLLKSSAHNLSTIFNSRMYPSVLVGDGKSIPVTNTGHSTLPTPYRPLHINNVLVTPNIVKFLISYSVDTDSSLLIMVILFLILTLICRLEGAQTVFDLYSGPDILCRSAGLFFMHDPQEPHFLASHSGSCDMFCDADWFTLSRSSAEAEYRGVANAVAETCWLRNLLRELHTPLSTTTIVYCDNVSAVYLSSNPVQHQRTKHIEIDIHFVRDLITTGHIRVLHVPSRYQYADIFIKGLPTALFDEFRDSLSVRSSPAQTAGGC